MQLQLFFDKVLADIKKKKELNAQWREALQGSQQHQEISEKQKALREKKKQIVESLKEDMGSVIRELEDLQIDMASDKEILSDAALTQLMKGKTVEVQDADGNKYEPIFKVTFKKS